ncbi:hypothetical protein DYB36_004717 [Aphanomyces astaci]|uniref:Protein kinase domain-containing protein n=1 Tax=Aphanomyces astaci TaxID=112090 RepID=A0A397B8R5_APHAT|nr:hypothetical protein DYB36_004717 [Aphanomyces astaci]
MYIYRDAYEVVLCSYDLLKLHLSELNVIEWYIVVLDELHNLKNPEAQITKAVQQLACKRKLGLSGTLMQNNADELHCVLEDAAAVSDASDVYAIGMLLVELDSQQPFDMTGIDVDDIDGTWHDRKVAAVAQSFSAKCPPDVQQLALRCVAAEPEDRPNVLEVASALDPYDQRQSSVVDGI